MSALSPRKPKENVNDFVIQGGTEKISEEIKKKSLTLWLEESVLQQVDALRKSRKVKVTRHHWLREAIQDRIEKETVSI